MDPHDVQPYVANLIEDMNDSSYHTNNTWKMKFSQLDPSVALVIHIYFLFLLIQFYFNLIIFIISFILEFYFKKFMIFLKHINNKIKKIYWVQMQWRINYSKKIV